MKSFNLSENIKRYRKEKGITQEELANKCGLSKNGLWNYENGKRQPNIDTLNKIASVLEVSFDELLGENTSDFNDKVPKKEDLTKLFRQGIVIITAPGMTIKDKIKTCYTIKDNERTYITIKFSNGHIIAAIDNIKKVDEMVSTLCQWQYDLFNSNKELECSVVKLKED